MKKHFFFFGGKRKGLLRGGEPCLRVLLFPASRMHFHSLFIRSSIPSLHLLPFPLSQTQCSSLRNSTASSTSFSSCPAREASANPPSQPSWRSRSLLATRPLACSISISVDPQSPACSVLMARAFISLLQGTLLSNYHSKSDHQSLVISRAQIISNLSLLPFCNRWVPVYADENKKLCCMSIGFMLENKDDSVVWRGPKKTGR